MRMIRTNNLINMSILDCIRFLLVMSVLLFLGNAAAQDSRSGWPGLERKLESAAVNADWVVVAALKSVGSPDDRGPGAAIFFDTQLEIKRVLKGKAGSMASVAMIYSAFALSETGKLVPSTPPEFGKTYIFFIENEKGQKWQNVSKVLPADDATVAAVVAAIGSTTGSTVPLPTPTPPEVRSPRITPFVSQTPSAAIVQPQPLWPWLLGLFAIATILAIILKRRA